MSGPFGEELDRAGDFEVDIDRGGRKGDKTGLFDRDGLGENISGEMLPVSRRGERALLLLSPTNGSDAEVGSDEFNENPVDDKFDGSNNGAEEGDFDGPRDADRTRVTLPALPGGENGVDASAKKLSNDAVPPRRGRRPGEADVRGKVRERDDDEDDADEFAGGVLLPRVFALALALSNGDRNDQQPKSDAEADGLREAVRAARADADDDDDDADGPPLTPRNGDLPRGEAPRVLWNPPGDLLPLFMPPPLLIERDLVPERLLLNT